MSVKERLKKFLKCIGISVVEFERSIDVSNGYVNSIAKSIGRQKESLILEKYPNLNMNWLLTGDGEMFTQVTKKVQPAAGIPLIPIEAMAGFGSGDQTILELDCERFVVPTFKGADFLIQVKGSSMYPKYNSGDIVACKKLLKEDLFFQWNKVYVLDTVQGALIKRVDMADDDDHIKLVSDNASYKPFPIHKSQIHAISIVIGVIRLE